MSGELRRGGEHRTSGERAVVVVVVLSADDVVDEEGSERRASPEKADPTAHQRPRPLFASRSSERRNGNRDSLDNETPKKVTQPMKT